METRSKFSGRPKDTERDRDGLDEYIHVSSTGIALTMLALGIALVGFVIWAFCGTLPVKVTAKGAVIHVASARQDAPEDYPQLGFALPEDCIVCFLNAEDYALDDFDSADREVTIEMPDHGRFSGRVIGMWPRPAAQSRIRDEIETLWVAEKSVQYEFSWVFFIDADLDYQNYSYMIPEVTLTLDEIRPISYLTQQGGGK